MGMLTEVVLSWLVLTFTLHIVHGSKVTGESCTLRHGALVCEQESFSPSEENDIVEYFKSKGCGLDVWDEESDEDVCHVFDQEVTSSGGGDEFQWNGEGQQGTILEPTNPLSEGQSSIDAESDPLLFHPRSAKNVIVSADGTVATRKLTEELGYGAAMAQRHLFLGEMFDVWIRFTGEKEYPWIGVTKYSPDTMEYPEQLLQLGGGTWCWDTYANEVIRDGETIVKPYVQTTLQVEGNVSLLAVKNGDRFGVSITDGGTLHFHHNGRDLGAADVGVNGKMYAFVDMYLGGSNATIVQ